MFYNIPFHELGFSDDEWLNLSRGDKVIIRDYVLNGCDREQTLLYDEYDTMYQVRRVEKQYELSKRPKLRISPEEFTFPM